MPSEIYEKVKKIFVKEGVWEDRSKWTPKDWERYWREYSLKNHELLEEDLKRLPKLKEIFERAYLQWPKKPKPVTVFRRKPKVGWLIPFV